MKKVIFALLALPLFFASCDKDDDPAPPAAANYQPTTIGSTWNYETTTKPANTKTSYTLTATSSDSTINGKTYKVFTNSGGDNDYYYNNGTDYYQFGGIAGITDNAELLYLKTNVAVGAGWDETKTVAIPGLGDASVKLNYTYFEKVASMTVEGNTYTDVLHIKVALSNITISGFPITITTQDLHFFYAPGVGRIKSQIKLTLTPPLGSPIAVDNETNLKSSDIK
jgi:hypothetical protein